MKIRDMPLLVIAGDGRTQMIAREPDSLEPLLRETGGQNRSHHPIELFQKPHLLEDIPTMACQIEPLDMTEHMGGPRRPERTQNCVSLTGEGGVHIPGRLFQERGFPSQNLSDRPGERRSGNHPFSFRFRRRNHSRRIPFSHAPGPYAMKRGSRGNTGDGIIHQVPHQSLVRKSRSPPGGWRRTGRPSVGWMSGQKSSNLSRIFPYGKIFESAGPARRDVEKGLPERVRWPVFDVGIEPVVRDPCRVEKPDPLFVTGCTRGGVESPVQKKGTGKGFRYFGRSAETENAGFGRGVVPGPPQIQLSRLPSLRQAVQKRSPGDLHCRRRRGFGQTVQDKNKLRFHRLASRPETRNREPGEPLLFPEEPEFRNGAKKEPFPDP